MPHFESVQTGLQLRSVAGRNEIIFSVHYEVYGTTPRTAKQMISLSPDSHTLRHSTHMKCVHLTTRARTSERRGVANAAQNADDLMQLYIICITHTRGCCGDALHTQAHRHTHGCQFAVAPVATGAGGVYHFANKTHFGPRWRRSA